MFELTGKTAIITGSGTGIGKATALLFAKQGANVVLVARRQNLLEQTAEECRALGAKALVVAGDLKDPETPKKVVDATVAEFGTIDILINNGGIADKNMSTIRCSDELWNDVIATNQTGPFRMCRAVLPVMEKQNKGSIVNIGSIGGIYALAGVSYSSAKMAVVGLTKNVAIQYVGTGIRVNCVCPGPTETVMMGKDFKPDPDADMEMLMMAGRRGDRAAGMCSVDEQAQAILFFASDQSTGITGQYIVVDKGSCI